MKASIISLALAGLAAAQDIPTDLPDCSNDCISKGLSGAAVSGCNPIKIECFCKSKDFLSNIACCLKASCDEDSQQVAIKYAKNFCGGVGVETPDSLDDLCKKNSGSESATASKSTEAVTGMTTSAPSTDMTSVTVTSGTDTAVVAPDTTTGTGSGASPTTNTEDSDGSQTSTDSASTPTDTPGAAASLSGPGSAIAGVLAMILAL